MKGNGFAASDLPPRFNLSLQGMDEADEQLTKDLTAAERNQLFSQINYDPKTEKLSILLLTTSCNK